MSDYTHIGYITKPHGYKGALKLKCILQDMTALLDLDMLMLEVNGSKVPFFIEQISHQANDMFIVKFEDVDDEDGAKALKSTEVFVSSELISEEDDSHPWTNFSIIDSESGECIGQIEEVMDIPNNVLGMLMVDGEELMIPLNDELIQKVDEDSQTITTIIPPGLLDLND